MSWKSTLLMVVLAGGAGAWFFLGDEVAPQLGLTPTNPEPTPSPAIAALDDLKPDDIVAVTVKYPSGETLEVNRANAKSPWRMPGNWPLRQKQVDELVETLGNLRTRFHVQNSGTDDLEKYGLGIEQEQLAVTLKVNAVHPRGGPTLLEYTLYFAEPKPTGDHSAFTRPAYVRLATSFDVLAVGPDVMPVLRRPPESYRRRQLFRDVERVRVVGGSPPAEPFGAPPADTPTTVTLPGEQTDSITVRGPGPKLFNFDLSPLATFTLKRAGKLPEPGMLPRGGEPALPVDRLGDAWKLSAPHPEPADPENLRSVLAAVAELWVDRFVTFDPAPVAIGFPAALESPLARAAREAIPVVNAMPPDKRMGFTDSKRAITLQPRDGEEMTVWFGGVARVSERDEQMTIPGGPPGSPPQTITRKVPTEYRYARLAGNPQVFIVAADKFDDLFVMASEMTDPRVARFEPDEVREIVIQPHKGDAIRLFQRKGDPKARNPEEREDRWFIAADPNPLLAETSRVNELLRKFSELQADSPEHREYPSTPPPAQTTITITAREQRAEGEPDAPTRTYSLAIARPDPVRNLLPVRLADGSRVSLVENKLGTDTPDAWLGALLFPETLAAYIDSPALAYRNLKLFDTANRSLRAVSVAWAFSMSKGTAGWQLTSPIRSEADAAKSDQLAGELSGLRATEFLSDRPTPEDLKRFGLEKPAHTITLEFTGGRKYTLELGAERPGKPEVFARLDRGGVFALPTSTTQKLTTGAVDLLPLSVWNTTLEKITSLEVIRAEDAAKQESFRLVREGSNWKLTAPFSAPVPRTNLEQLAALSKLTAARYQSLTVSNPAEFGFDQPFLRVRVTHLEQKPGETTETPTQQTVIVGGLAPLGGNRYARLDVPDAPVFVVGPDFLHAAQTRPLNLLDRSLLSLDPGRIAKVRVSSTKPEEAFTLAKDAGGKWNAEGTTFAVDAERIETLTATAARLPVGRLVAYGDAIKWADYGLEKPTNTITITTRGDKPTTHTIALGNLDPTGSRFVRVDNRPAVGVIDAPDAEVLVREKFEYADRTLLTFDPITLVGLARKTGKDELEIAPGAAIGWDIVKPVEQKADQPFVDELAEALGRLKAQRVAAYGKKAEMFQKFGLEPPTATITVTVGAGAEQKTLRIGKPIDDKKPEGDRYAAVESSAPEVIVGVLPATLAKKLLAPPVAFRDRTLARFVDADKLVLQRGDRKITFARSGITWKVTEPLMAPAESAALETLVADLGKLRADTWVAERGKDLKPFGLDKPEARWTVSYDDRAVLVLLIGKKTADGRVHVATEKGELVGLLDATRSDRVLAEYRQRKPWDVDAAQVQSVEIASGSAKFTLEKDGTTWIDPAKPGDAIDSRVVNELLGTLGGLRVERYAVDTDADLKLFGLAEPELTLTVTSPTGKRVLAIGGTVGGTDGRQRYARVAHKDRTDVFVLSAADTTRLTRDRTAYLMKK